MTISCLWTTGSHFINMLEKKIYRLEFVNTETVSVPFLFVTIYSISCSRVLTEETPIDERWRRVQGSFSCASTALMSKPRFDRAHS